MIRTLALSALALGAVAPAAFASCDISGTKCDKDGSKCNIKFRNVTDSFSNEKAEDTKLLPRPGAQIIKVKALKEDGTKAGNALTINSRASKTMNLDKKAKKNFEKIRITSPTMAVVTGVTMSCWDVRQVLDGNGTCKIFVGHPEFNENNNARQLGYSCDSGSVSGPK